MKKLLNVIEIKFNKFLVNS